MAADFERLYATYGPMVLRRCRRLLRDEGTALDAMHDVFVELLRRRDRLRGGSPVSLLLKTATNVCLNRIRTARRHPEDRAQELLLAIASQDDHAIDSRAIARKLLDRLFARTPEATRFVAVLYYVDRLTLKEVASCAGISVPAVRRRLQALQRCLPSLSLEERHA